MFGMLNWKLQRMPKIIFFRNGEEITCTFLTDIYKKKIAVSAKRNCDFFIFTNPLQVEQRN